MVFFVLRLLVYSVERTLSVRSSAEHPNGEITEHNTHGHNHTLHRVRTLRLRRYWNVSVSAKLPLGFPSTQDCTRATPLPCFDEMPIVLADKVANHCSLRSSFALGAQSAEDLYFCIYLATRCQNRTWCWARTKYPTPHVLTDDIMTSISETGIEVETSNLAKC